MEPKKYSLSEHPIQYTDDGLWNCTLATYIILFSNVTPRNSIQINKFERG